MQGFRVDPYLTRVFNSRTYTCFDFAREVWLAVTGKDLGNQVLIQSGSEHYAVATAAITAQLVKLNALQDPCLVLFERNGLEPHVGVYFKGRILHLNKSGAFYMPLDYVSRGYKRINFYR